MKRYAALLLIITLLLTACGNPTRPKELTATAHSTTTAMSTTTIEATTQTTAPTPVPVIDEVAWRVIDTDDAMQERMRSWIEEDFYNEGPGELVLSDTKTVTKKREETGGSVTPQLFLRENGSETLLWESEYSLDSDMGSSPILSCAIDERYVLIGWQGYEWMSGHSIFDTREKKETPISVPDIFLGSADGYLYFAGAAGREIERIQVVRAKWRGGKLQTEDLLAGVPGTKASDGALMGFGLLSPDGRYFTTGTHIFDLRQRKCVFQLDDYHDSFKFPHFEDEHTLYLYTTQAPDNRFALEIKFP